MFWVFIINTLDHLSKSPLINNFSNLISIAKLFSNGCQIIALFISNRILILPTNFTDSVYTFINSELNFFKFCKFRAEFLKCFLSAPPIKTSLYLSNEGCALRAWSFCLLRHSSTVSAFTFFRFFGLSKHSFKKRKYTSVLRFSRSQTRLMLNWCGSLFLFVNIKI